jgi:hypothetical protein
MDLLKSAFPFWITEDGLVAGIKKVAVFRV